MYISLGFLLLFVFVIFVFIIYVLRGFFLDFIHLFLERGKGREKERERNIDG